MRRAAPCSVLVILAVAAGCGGGGSDDAATTANPAGAPVPASSTPPLAVKDYQRRVVDAISAMGRFAATLSKVQRNNLKKLAPEFSSEARAFAQQEATVASLTPPPRLKAAHLRLVDALQSVSRAMNDLADGARSNDHLLFLNADADFVKASEQVAAAARALQSASG